MFNDLRKYLMTIPLALLFLFMLIGYLEAKWTGMFAGLILGNVAMFFLPLSLIPFAGIPLWFMFTRWIFGVVGSYLPISSLTNVVMIIIGILSILICFLTTILSCVGVWFLFFKKKKVLTAKQNWTIPKEVQILIEKLPKIDVTKVGNIQDIVNQIIEFSKGFLDKIDMRLIMDVVFWFGLGIASHDFWWESQEANVDVTRPTHGANIGLQMAIFALDYQTSMTTPNLWDRIKLEIPMYIGFVTAYFGFLLTKILPKGFPRIICHFFWWTGISLMVYNWYECNKTRIFPKINRKT
jgi:hypothetical protein